MAASERMREMRNRRRERGLRELRLSVPDPRRETVRAHIAAEVARLESDDETAALRFIGAISDFDAPDSKGA